MIQAREVPFVRLLLPFVLGIYLANLVGTTLPYLSALLWIFLPLIAWLSFRQSAYQNRWLAGVVFHCFLLLLGYALCLNHNELAPKDHFKNQWTKGDLLIAQIAGMPKQGKHLEAVVQVIGRTSAGHSKAMACSGAILCKIQANAKSRRLQYGDKIVLNTRPLPIFANKNPHAFDYRQYMHFQNIHFQTTVDSADWELLATASGFSPLRIAFQWRQRFLKILRQHLPTPDEYAVGAALILGYKSDLSPEVRKAYTGTGAMHVLAVSGLHVGLIYLLLHFLLGLIRWSGLKWKIAKILLQLIGIWSFALLTGASASVLRAASMFSFMIVGKGLWRHTNIYNTLAASAFCLLYVNPYLLMHVGFQLSYLAVGGIVYFQPRIYRLWIIDNRWGDHIWKLLSISLAAQIMTFPISLYYFNQFPVYFWLSGLLIVPAATFILIGGIGLLFVHSCLPFLAFFVGKCLFGIIWLTNAGIFLIEKLPFGLAKSIWIDPVSLLLLYAWIVLLAIGIHLKQFKYVLAATAVFLALSLKYAAIDIYQQRQQKITLYDAGRNGLVDFFAGQELSSWKSKDLAETKETFLANRNRMAQGAKAVNTLLTGDINSSPYLAIHQNTIKFRDRAIIIVTEPIHCLDKPLPKVDVLMVRNAHRLSFDNLLECLDFDLLVVDGSTYPKVREKWMEQCEKKKLNCWDIKKQGAISIEN
ncbi:MAG: ComEC/Rec2 family competence protein [Bacteroidota bacterium]